jgi:hypothetical protein
MTLFSQHEKSNTVSLHGQLSELDMSDINSDGVSDILLGISKKVNFDPVHKKRINIYTFSNENLQPLWLGTKFVYDIRSFSVKDSAGLHYLITTEIDEAGIQYNGVYQWDDFGFALNEMNQISNNEKK